jgi:hypothetical protein
MKVLQTLGDIEFSKNGIAEIDVETLSKTSGIIHVDQLKNRDYKKMPMLTYELCNLLTDEISKSDAMPNLESKIYIYSDSCFGITREKDPHSIPIESVVMSKMIGYIKSTNNEDLNLSVGFAVSDGGIRLAIGSEVQICSNFTILGDKQEWGTFGNNRMDFFSIMKSLKERITHARDLIERDYRIMQSTKQIEVREEELTMFLGKLIQSAVMSNYNTANKKEYSLLTGNSSPLNVTQVSRFTEQIYDSEHFKLSFDTKSCSVWDIINAGTNFMRPIDGIKPATAFQSNRAWCNAVVNEFAPHALEVHLN